MTGPSVAINNNLIEHSPKTRLSFEVSLQRKDGSRDKKFTKLKAHLNKRTSEPIRSNIKAETAFVITIKVTCC